MKKLIGTMLVASSIFAFAQGESNFKLDQIVVTGTKTERKIDEVAVRTKIVSREDIEAKGAVNLYQALESVPGLHVESQCSACNFTMVRMHGLPSDDLQILIDGQPVYTGLAAVYGLQQIPVSNIDRIEIIDGAGSSLYGSGAAAGVINVITRKPAKDMEDDSIVKYSFQKGENNTDNYKISASKRFGDKADLIITSQKDHQDAIDEGYDNDGGTSSDRVWSENSTIGFRTNIYELSGNDVLTFAYAGIDEKRKGGDVTGDIENPFAEGSENILTLRDDYTLGYSKKLDDKREISYNLNYSEHERDATNDTFVGDYLGEMGTYPGSNILKPYIADEKNTVFGVDYKLKKDNNRNFLFGMQYSKNELEENGNYFFDNDGIANANGTAYSSITDKEATNYGIYAQAEVKTNERTEVVFGLRYDNHESTDTFKGRTFGGASIVGLNDESNDYNESDVNPRAAIIYKPEDDLTLRMNIGTGFRVPYSFSEDLHLCSGSPRVYKGNNLDPEDSLNFGISADWRKSDYRYGINLFRTKIDKKIELADAISPNAIARNYDYEWINEGEAVATGIELEFEKVFENKNEFSAYITYTNAEYNSARSDWSDVTDAQYQNGKFASDSKHLPRVPETKMGIDYKLISKENIKYNIGGEYTGEQYIDYYADDGVSLNEIIKTSGFWTLNFRAEKEDRNTGIKYFVGAKNLTDKIQKDRRTDDAAFIYMPLTGRVVYAGMEMEF